MSIYTYIHMYKENVQLKNPLYAAFCVTKNIYPRCKFSNLTGTPMYSSRLYAKNPVFEIVHEESVKVYHLHMYNRNIRQNSLCVESCVTEKFHISPRLSPAFFHRDAMVLHVIREHHALGAVLLFSVRLDGEYSVLRFTEYQHYEKEQTAYF